MKILKRILAVVVSSLILALGISLTSHIPEEQREPDVYYMGVSEIFIFTIWFALVFYTVIGIPASWIIDKCRKRYSDKHVAKRYLIGMAFYSLAGITSGALFYSSIGYIQFFLHIFLETVVFWVVSAILYFHILWLLEREFFTNSTNKREEARNR